MIACYVEGVTENASGKPTDQELLAENIRARRQAAGLSQADLSSKMKKSGHTNWHQNTVSRVEAGRQMVRSAEYRTLTTILGPGLLDGTNAGGALRLALANSMQSSVRAEFITRIEHIRDEAERQYLDLMSQLDELIEYVEVIKEAPDDGEHQEAP